MSQIYRVNIDPDHPERALETEWLLTNGLGGYAMGTALGVNTRRYHGLFVAALHPPVRRYVVIHSLIEEITIGGVTHSVSTSHFGSEFTFHPNGYSVLESFEIQHSFATWMYRIGDVRVTRSLLVDDGSAGVSISYAAQHANGPVRFRVRPVMPLRSSHDLESDVGVIRRFDDAPTDASFEYERCGIIARVAEAGNESGLWIEDPQVWRGFAYREDQQRGQEFLESIHSPGYLEFEGTGGLIQVDVSPVRKPGGGAPALRTDRNSISAASGHFLVRRDGPMPTESIIAGYPWFSDWGRDAMIAMPGIMLCNRRYAEANRMLLSFAQHMRNGLIPNHFDDHTGEALYNTVDASLWFVYAVYQLWQVVHEEAEEEIPLPASSLEEGRELMDACRAIVHAYRDGTDFNIFMDDDGLIAAGDETTQLTWMDARRDGVVFTPRHGKAVEINSLWFNALYCLTSMTDDDDERSELIALADRVRASFRRQFWWVDHDCLHDVLMPDGHGGYCPDGKLRPNQIFAVSLPHSPLDRAHQRAIVDVVRERFLTPFGLRTLDRDDPDYRPRYEGDMMRRDAAYHNGTVWPWLIGPYCEALLRVNDFSDEAKRMGREAIRLLIDSMHTGCLGQIAEIYDGEPPHRPDGCPAQAWSVAEVLRIQTLVRDVT